MSAPPRSGLQLTELYLYPLKSGGAVRVDAIELDASGPLLDRRWMAVDRNGVFLSQRSHPRMALLAPRIHSGSLELRFPGLAALQLPLAPEGGDRIQVEVWEDRIEAELLAVEAHAWISAALETDARLVRFVEGTSRRPTDPRYAPGGQVAFADGYPLLAVTQASMDALNRRLRTPVGADRFRPNLVVRGGLPHSEDHWRRIRIGSVDLQGVKACARCSVPAIDPALGSPDPSGEPLRTLNGYRTGGGKLWFGQNLTATLPGALRADDAVEVLERGEALPLGEPPAGDGREE